MTESLLAATVATLSAPIDLEAFVKHPAYLDFHGSVIPSAGRQAVTSLRLAMTSW